MKLIKFKDVKDGQVFQISCDKPDPDIQRIKGVFQQPSNNKWVTRSSVRCSDIHPDLEVYVDEPEIPELDKGIYCMAKHDSPLWLFGLYDGIEDGRYRFQQAKNTGTFTINPQKWYVGKFMLKSL